MAHLDFDGTTPSQLSIEDKIEHAKILADSANSVAWGATYEAKSNRQQVEELWAAVLAAEKALMTLEERMGRLEKLGGDV